MKKNNIAAWKTYLNKHINNTENCKFKFIISPVDISIYRDPIQIQDCITSVLGDCSINAQFDPTGDLLIAISSRYCNEVLLKHIYNDNYIKNILYDYNDYKIFLKNALKHHIVTYTNPPEWFDYQSIEWLNTLLTAMQQSNVNFEVIINDVRALIRTFRYVVNIDVTLKVSISKLIVTPIQTLNINSSGNIPAVPIIKCNCNSVNLSGRIINFPDNEPIELNHDRLAGILCDMAKQINQK